MTPLKENIIEQQEKIHDIKMECFTIIHKVVNKVKVLEKHLKIVSQINLKMESLQVKIEELDRWRSIEKNGLPMIKTYDIILHTLATSEGQKLASILKKELDKILQERWSYKRNQSMISKDTFSGPRSTLKMNIWFLFPPFKSLKTYMKVSILKFKQMKTFPRKIFKNF